MARVWHYDGASGIRYEPELIVDGNGFRLGLEGGTGEHLGWSDLVYAGDREGRPTYGLKSRRGWRIGVIDDLPAEIAARLPRRQTYGGVIDRIGLVPAIGAFAALSAVALFIAVKTPEWLTPLVPQSLEQRLGEAMIGDFGGRICKGPGGQEALDALVRRIEPDPTGLKVHVVNIGMVNAVALPGGYVFIFRGLLQEAKSPAELAGVVGHEIGHVRHRDVMQSLLRQMGLSVLMGGMDGTVSGGVNTMLATTYSREAEASADQYSIRAMQKASVSPEDTAAFFGRLAEMEKKLVGDKKRRGLLGYLSSHPMSASRERAFRASAVKGATHAPPISPQQWRAIIDSCANDSDVNKDDSFF